MILVQRDNSTGNVKALGDRVFHNIEQLDAVLDRYRRDRKIRYRGVTVLTGAIATYEQACLAAGAGIFIAMHGNALALTAFMERGSVMLEIRGFNDYYADVSRSLGMQRINWFPRVAVRPEPDKFAAQLEQALAKWHAAFKPSS